MTEAIEANELRVQMAEETKEAAAMRVKDLQEKLQATEAALEKERLISQEALNVQASAEADLSAVKDISHKVLGDCRTLQDRIQELENERKAPSEAEAKIWELERARGNWKRRISTCGDNCRSCSRPSQRVGP